MPKSPEQREVVVVGAGVIGLSIAWRAVQRGMRPVVLDAAGPGAGASGVAAGMLAPVTEADFGEEALLELNLAASRMYPRFVAEVERSSGEPTGYAQSGALNVAVDRDHAEELARLHELQRSLGLDARWLSARECRALEPGLSTRVAGGIEAPGDHQISPRRLLAALRAAIERGAGRIRADARVASVSATAGDADGVVLESGEHVRAHTVVLAAGARSTEVELPGTERIELRPVKGQILRLRGDAAHPPAKHVVRTPDVYAVPRADGRLVVGATVEEKGFDASVTAGGVLDLLRDAYDVLPGITELELVEAAAGHRPATPDNLPVIGEGELPHLVWATGHWRNGVLLAPITAAAVVDLIEGAAPAHDLAGFSPRRFAAAEVTR